MDFQEAAQAEQMRQMEEMKKQMLNKILSKDASERLSRVRIVNKVLASQAELYLLQIYQSGRLKDIVTDDQMKEILRLLSEKKDFTIKRR